MAATTAQPAGADAPFGTSDTQARQSQHGAAGHQRTYQACIPCRQRKVRCDLGSVDNPHDPPCSRCKRESKECYFSATRRKKKHAGGDAGSDVDEDEIYEIKNGRKRLRTSVAPEPEPEELIDEVEVDRPRTPGGSVGRTRPLRRPTAGGSIHYGEEDEKASEQTTAILQSAEVHGGHDALKVLYQAALGRDRAPSQASAGARPNFNGLTPGSLPAATSPVADKARLTSYGNGPMAMFQNDRLWKTQVGNVDPKISMMDSVHVDSVAYANAIKAWSRFRFVRAGWFTPKEGIEYILYFYKFLAPLTPVVLPDFQAPSAHKKLLEQEPMLAVTILLIASRHMNLEGPGSNSRPYAIHQKLWTYLSGMIDRVVWGQEQFGGGFCGAGAQPGCDVNPLTRKGLRTMGSVESLVLLTEWHPRAMHFPPNEDDDELMVPDERLATPDVADANDTSKGIGGQRMDAWLEPCWRSDRMCWMLLGMAMSLAFEIGVFDASEWQRHASPMDGQTLSADELAAYDRRRGNVRDLLLVYVTQTSGRLGLTSMLPGNYSKPEDSALFGRELGKQKSIQEVTLHFWLRIAALMREGNRSIFANKSFTRDLIRNGNYKAALEKLHVPLSQWRRDFDESVSIPKYMRCILEIEYEYCRVYLNALALQAVAERCANDHPSPASTLDPPLEMARSAVAANGAQPDVVISPATLAKWLGGDRHYMLTVGEAARNLLKIVVDDLYPGGYLRHAPVRTYFRIISVAIMLLKTFALGATESAVTDSLTLMDRTVEALRTCIVDDVHVASRFADLLDILTQNLKPRLVRINGDGRSNHRGTRRVSQHVSSQAASGKLDIANQKEHQQAQHNAAMPASTPGQQQPQPWEYNPMLHAGNTPNSNPLFGISNDTYDLMGTDNQFSVMPPPGFNTSSPNSSTGGNLAGAYDAWSAQNGYGMDSNSRQDWLTLPLDPLLNISGADVNQTMYGPELGGTDMLELLLNPNNSNGY